VIHIRKEQDKSMNQDKGFYQVPHFHDYLLSARVTPGGQSFRRRQQWLPKRQQKRWIQRLYFDEFVNLLTSINTLWQQQLCCQSLW